jgi:hypothetical protein
LQGLTVQVKGGLFLQGGRMRILILIDYRGQFWLKSTHKEANFDLELLRSSFAELGYGVQIQPFSEVSFNGRSYENTFVVYQSTQDDCLLYKSYIEDILLGLKLAGATLIPDFHFFRAHHNKVFMEILRCTSSLDQIKNIRSRWFGTYEEYLANLNEFQEMPVVFKLADGDQSKHVRLLKNPRDKLLIPRRLSATFSPYGWAVNKIKPLLRTTYPGYHRRSDHRRKFIVQDFVPDLDGDFKVLVFYGKYYVLHRRTRKNDFRASGSGLFSFRRQLPAGLLDFAARVFDWFQVPFISLDVASKDSHFFLMEFQFVHFGCYTLEKSDFYFVRGDGGWRVVDQRSVLEKEFARSVVSHIQRLDSPRK